MHHQAALALAVLFAMCVLPAGEAAAFLAPSFVREPDGIHLNGRGAGIAADAVLEAIRQDFPQ